MNELPIFFTRKEECCGCMACYAICSKKAISIEEDEKGFEYPKVEGTKCVRCFMCLTICPIKAEKDTCQCTDSRG